jgi:hypothetical protein
LILELLDGDWRVKRDLKALYYEKNILGKSGLIHQPTVNTISYLKYDVIFYSFSKIGHETTFLEYVWGKYLCAISIRVNQ